MYILKSYFTKASTLPFISKNTCLLFSKSLHDLGLLFTRLQRCHCTPTEFEHFSDTHPEWRLQILMSYTATAVVTCSP
jgi:hypothetical protein